MTIPQRISVLEAFFESKAIDYAQKIELKKGIVISDLKKFITNHLAFIKANQESEYFKPYLLRLEKVKNAIK